MQRAVFSGGIAICIALAVVRSEEPTESGPKTEARFPSLVVPAGFKATLFACDPLVEYPSAIAAGPRPGAIFVAVDYMTGLGTEIVRRSEVRLVEDTDGDGYADRAPVFADGFNSIQGLAWHDGTLFVMHAPFLTAVRATEQPGIADGRKNLLTGLGLTPEENPVRLHCANGVVVGHDGWLYLALGDHGCDVLRPEGDRLVFHGGGILRCRQDGHDLHVFATGLRNIYDVALNEELDVFVRDNENDGGTYKIRVCHSFHGAAHGYPYLYEERPSEALAPLADLGLGSSAGGACYLERQFPQEYRGNLLFCEWGKSVVRYPLQPRGSGFERPNEIEFAAGAKHDPYGFKPTDLVVQRDGTLMVSDYADGQRPKRGRGRIYIIAYVGEETNSRANSTSAALAATLDDWLVRLDSESYYERCDAQQAIQRGGPSALRKLTEAVAQRRLGGRGRVHAVWILANAGSSAIDDLLRLAEQDAEPRVRAQAIRAVADLADPVLVHHRLDAPRGEAALAARLAALSKGQDPKVLLETCIALGRMRWPETAKWIKANLRDPDASLAHAAMQALRRGGNWPTVFELVDAADSDPLRRIALTALAERYDADVVDGLVTRLQHETSTSRRGEYADLLTRVYKQPGPWTYWGYRPPPRAANTASWERSEAIAAALDHALASFEPAERLTLLRRMQREQVPLSASTLTRWLTDERQAERVAAILAALRGNIDADTRYDLEQVIRNQDHSIANRQTALAHFGEGLDDTTAQELLSLCQRLEDGPVLADALHLLAKHSSLAAAPLLATKLDSRQPEVRAAAVEAFSSFPGALDRRKLLALLADEDNRVRRSAAVAAGKLMAKDAVEPLLKLVTDNDPAVRRASFAALRLLNEERALPRAVAALRDGQVHLQALQFVRQLGGPAQATPVTELAKNSPSIEVLDAAVRTLIDWRNRQGTTARMAEELDRAVAEIQGTTGILNRWEVRGPLTADSAATFGKQMSWNLGGNDDSAWRTLFAAGTEARVIVGHKDAASPDGSWLARSSLRVSEPTAVEFLASSSGSLRVWLNGQNVYERNEPQSFRIDSDRFSATLDKGDNRLVVLIDRSTAAAEMHLRLRRKSAMAEHERLAQAALARAGNADRGRQVFLNTEKSLCLKCHRVGEQGERIGPELTGVGNRFSTIYVIESILEPSRTIAPSFGTTVALLKTGQMLSGVLTTETLTDIALVDNQGQRHVLQKSEIDEQKSSPLSTMPEGLEKRMSEPEFVDLIAFLMSLKEVPSPDNKGTASATPR